MFSLENFSGQNQTKSFLANQINQKKTPHAQLFVGNQYTGILPLCLAYISEILKNSPINKLIGHPDIHFSFPIFSKQEYPTICYHFLEQWSDFVTKNPYGNFNEWCELIDSRTKQMQIGVEEAQKIIQFASLKPSFQEGYKIIFIWHAEKMNISASNKLLKILEEPPHRTLFILMAESEEQIIKTIRSRCQVIRLETLTKEEVLKNNFRPSSNNDFESLFVSWVRLAFMVSKKSDSFKKLVDWSESIAQMGKEKQKSFLIYALELFRQAFLNNYKLPQFISFSANTDFSFDTFSTYIGPHNIFSISKEINKAYDHIERNGHTKIVFNNLCINLSRYLLKKS